MHVSCMHLWMVIFTFACITYECVRLECILWKSACIHGWVCSCKYMNIYEYMNFYEYVNFIRGFTDPRMDLWMDLWIISASVSRPFPSLSHSLSPLCLLRFYLHLSLFSLAHSSISVSAMQLHMQRFVSKIVSLMKSERLFASQGGPIIISQVNNSLLFFTTYLLRCKRFK